MSSYKKDSPRFDGTNYTLWKNHMECHLQCMGMQYWIMASKRYTPPQNGPRTIDEIRDAENNLQAKEALLSALSDSEMTNVIDLKTAYEIWEKLELLHEGDKYVKCAKLQSLKGNFENLKMSEDENITSYMTKVNELVCGIRCAGGILDEDEIVAKVLISLPPAYKHKVVAIEEIRSLTTISRDQLVGKISAFELAEFGDALLKTESAFKASASIKGKQRYDLGESSSRKSSWYEKARKDLEKDEVEAEQLEALITKILPRGSDKYEEKLPFK